ncbi:glycyl-tRNA synthetase alpha chain [Lentilactobacillus farraginis DSM 18382 = JCM 14108]|uniref:Glycyl-tRNA synthetase alpha chain n=1 Tax=Lentilactobacillus farraginis DSM 18382 = JCM 14108 TaxID=1423743 RepID=X0Q9V1_9LACO|nr:glycyl-tRNA synthetase alpha chain [Lentilactobacillus farraginis DSM 18382 = JCM 14108]
MTEKLSVQEIILRLQQYWAAQGCMLMQAYDTEKGAGTMSPIPFYGQLVRSLGTPLTLNHQDGRQMVGMAKTPIDFINIINFK